MFKKGVKEVLSALIQRVGWICMILMGGTLTILEPKDGLIENERFDYRKTW